MYSVPHAQNYGTMPLYSNSISTCQTVYPSNISFNQSKYPISYPLGNVTHTMNNNIPICSYIMQVPLESINCQKSFKKPIKRKKKTDNNEEDSTESKMPRKKFSKEEDEKLRSLVESMGSKKWEQIAKEMPGRTGRQCRDRYQNYLIPGFFNGQWSRAEDDLLQKKFIEYGSQWSKIKQFFKNRSANALKNRWNYFVSRNLHLSSHVDDCNSQEIKEVHEEKILMDENSTENDNSYENIINCASSLALIDLEPANENEPFIYKEEYLEFPFISNEI